MKKTITTLSLITLSSVTGSAAVIATYTHDTSTSVASTAAGYTANDVTGNNFTPDLAAAGSVSLAGNSLTLNTTGPADPNVQFFNYSVSADPGFTASYTSIDIDIFRGERGSATYEVSYFVGGLETFITPSAQAVDTAGTENFAFTATDITDFRVYFYARTASNNGGARTNLSEFIINGDVAAVPEPSSTALLGLGGLALILRRRK